jgi:hypothetical protein
MVYASHSVSKNVIGSPIKHEQIADRFPPAYPVCRGATMCGRFVDFRNWRDLRETLTVSTTPDLSTPITTSRRRNR